MPVCLSGRDLEDTNVALGAEVLKSGIITQARMSSTRLPGKVLLDLAGKPVLLHHLERLKWSNLPVHVATTDHPVDDSICDLCEKQGIPFFRGSETDVLGRFHACAKAAELDVVVRVTSDCPLVDGKLIGACVAEFESWNDPTVYYSNAMRRTFPRGFDFEIFSFAALDEAHRNAISSYEREHVTPYLNRNISGRMQIRDCVFSRDASRFRVTLDTREDLRLLRVLFEQLGASAMNASEIVELMEFRPELHEINNHVEQRKD